jgi:hypothetical protein
MGDSAANAQWRKAAQFNVKAFHDPRRCPGSWKVAAVSNDPETDAWIT